MPTSAAARSVRLTSTGLPAGVARLAAEATRCGMRELRVRRGAVLVVWRPGGHVSLPDAAGLLAAVCSSTVERVVLVHAPMRVLRAFGSVAGHVRFEVAAEQLIRDCWWMPVGSCRSAAH